MSTSGSETRERILAASLELLVASQGKGVRVSDIAKRAGISRQALYLHFGTRAGLLIATTHYIDGLKGSDARLEPSRSSTSGVERLDAFIEAWGNYIPDIYGLAKALLAMSDTDEAAAQAWRQRMRDMREGCAAAIEAMAADGTLSPDYDATDATDILWTMLSVRNWEQSVHECGWPQSKYIETVTGVAHKLLVAVP